MIGPEAPHLGSRWLISARGRSPGKQLLWHCLSWLLLLNAWTCAGAQVKPLANEIAEGRSDLPAEKQDEDTTGTVEGLVTFSGEIPKARVADETGSRRDLLEVDSTTRGLQHVVAYLVGKDPIRPNAGNTSTGGKKPVLIDQMDHTFVPRLIAIRSGQPVKFTNSDAANHNVRASSRQPKNEFNVYVGNGSEYRHSFLADPKARPITIACDIHPWMRAWVYVFDHPFYAVTDGQGRFRMASIPPGEYQLVIEQPDAGHKSQRMIAVAAQKTARVDVPLKREDLRTP